MAALRPASAALVVALGLAGCDARRPEVVPVPAAPEAPEEPAPPPEAVGPEAERTYIWDTGPSWLAGCQNEDGSWGRDGEFGLTGLVVLAYLSCGETHRSGASKDTVKAAVLHLIDVQHEDGRLADLDAPLGFSTHVAGTLALTEAYGMTGTRRLKEPAQRALDVLLAARTAEGGWEGTSAIWATMALKSTQMAELDMPADAVERAAAWIGSRIDVTTGRTSMRVGARSASALWIDGDALAAGAIVARVFGGESPRRSAELRAGARRLLDRARDESLRQAPDADDAYMTTLVLWQMPDELWVPWVERLHEFVPQDVASRSGETSDDAIRDVALRVLTWRGTQGYRRVFAEDRR